MAEHTPTHPVVCLPGLRGDARIFEPLVACAPAGLLLPVDLPPGAPALAASRLRAALPAGPVHLLTGSFGGLVARFLPTERIRSLACIGTLPTPRHLDPAMVRRARALMCLPDPLLESLYARHTRRTLSAEGLPAVLIDRLLERPTCGRILRMRLRGVIDAHHGTVPAVPVAWIHGADDAQVRWTPAELRADLPRVHGITVPGGHFPHASHPRALWETLQSTWWPTVDPPTEGATRDPTHPRSHPMR